MSSDVRCAGSCRPDEGKRNSGETPKAMESSIPLRFIAATRSAAQDGSVHVAWMERSAISGEARGQGFLDSAVLHRGYRECRPGWMHACSLDEAKRNPGNVCGLT